MLHQSVVERLQQNREWRDWDAFLQNHKDALKK